MSYTLAIFLSLQTEKGHTVPNLEITVDVALTCTLVRVISPSQLALLLFIISEQEWQWVFTNVAPNARSSLSYRIRHVKCCAPVHMRYQQLQLSLSKLIYNRLSGFHVHSRSSHPLMWFLVVKSVPDRKCSFYHVWIQQSRFTGS